MEETTIETELTLQIVDGEIVLPKLISCPNCGYDARRRPVNRYYCSKCGSVTTLDEKALEEFKRSRRAKTATDIEAT